MIQKQETPKKFLLKRRTELVWLLEWEGFSDIQIGEILNIDRTWVYTLRMRKPKGWKPILSKV